MTKKTNNDNKGVSFCFTDFDKKNIDCGYGAIFEDYKDIIRGIAYGKETCPTTGKIHNQAFIQMYKQTRYTAIQKMIKSKAHFEVMFGSIEQNENYCSKENVYTKFGSFVSRGFRSDLHNIKDDLKNGSSLYDIMENYTGDFIRYSNGIQKMKSLIDNKQANKFRTVKTTALIGEAGSGKTSYVTEKYGYENVFIVENGQDEKFLFDGYDGEKTILIDDFNGNIKYTTLLRILDGHKYGINIKNGRTYAKWENVYITSNNKPAKWYRKIGENLKRRIKNCLLVSEGNTSDLTHPWEFDDDTDDEYGDNNIKLNVIECC